MLTGLSLVFVVITVVVFLFFGLIWDSSNKTNLAIKCVNFLGAITGICAITQFTQIPVFYFLAVATLSMAGGRAWRANNAPNTVIKILLIILATVALTGFFLTKTIDSEHKKGVETRHEVQRR